MTLMVVLGVVASAAKLARLNPLKMTKLIARENNIIAFSVSA
jgi:hypothetical protein